MNPFKWRIVTDGKLYAVRRRSYFFGLYWVYRSLGLCLNWTSPSHVDEWCWGNAEVAKKVLRSLSHRKAKDLEENKDEDASIHNG